MSQVSFVGLEPTDAIRAYAEQKVRALSREPDLRSCRVVLEAHHHAHAGSRFRAKFELDVPRQTLVVGAHGEAFGDPYAAIDAGYDDAKRALRDRASRRREQRRGA